MSSARGWCLQQCMHTVPDMRLLERARDGDEVAFRALVEPHRRSLQLHCYRMVGSVQDSEDLVQETLLAAWRGLHAFNGGAKLRTWLYRIATNTCLNALRARSRRPRPAVPPAAPPARVEPSRVADPTDVEPYPDALLDRSAEPETRYEQREAIELAFVAALQQLPARQRAVLVLRDVLGFRASEAAEALDTTVVAVNSALQRAHAALDDTDAAPRASSARERELAGRIADAFERGDVGGVVALLTGDAQLTMPPQPFEYHGREAICRFLSAVVPPDGFRLLATRANGRPAYAMYERGGTAHGLLVLTVADDGVAAITAFVDTAILPAFGLPRSLTDESGAAAVSERA
jgi:RNA polymerase sigma-70 factor (TIGR02960 family)